MTGYRRFYIPNATWFFTVNLAELLDLIVQDPYCYPPEFEILKGDLQGAISRRINQQHRLVYQVLEEQLAIKVIMMWTHYE